MIDLKSLSKLSDVKLDRNKKILIVLFCVILVYVDVNYVLKMQTASLKKISANLSKLKTDFDKFNKDTQEMNRIKGNPALMKAKPQGAKRIISDSDVSGLLQDIAGSANKSDIKILQIKPLKDISPADKVPGADKFSPLTITLDTICDYHQLGKFINALENGEIYMRVAEIRISTQQADYFKQRASLAIKTYVKK